jgi:hypothetical protein
VFTAYEQGGVSKIVPRLLSQYIQLHFAIKIQNFRILEQSINWQCVITPVVLYAARRDGLNLK